MKKKSKSDQPDEVGDTSAPPTEMPAPTHFLRARVDIRDLNINGFDDMIEKGTVDRRPVVAVAKHLCGVATDLGLRSLLTTRTTQAPVSSDDWPGIGNEDQDLNVAGVCIATCCHHCCNWTDFVAKGFFMEVSLYLR